MQVTRGRSALDCPEACLRLLITASADCLTLSLVTRSKVRIRSRYPPRLVEATPLGLTPAPERGTSSSSRVALHHAGKEALPQVQLLPGAGLHNSPPSPLLLLLLLSLLQR